MKSRRWLFIVAGLVAVLGLPACYYHYGSWDYDYDYDYDYGYGYGGYYPYYYPYYPYWPGYSWGFSYYSPRYYSAPFYRYPHYSGRHYSRDRGYSQPFPYRHQEPAPDRGSGGGPGQRKK